MQSIRRFVRVVDHFTETTGRWLTWLCLAMTLVTCLVVIMRYGLGVGSVALQESVTYMHATLFMAGAAYTLKRGGHVRVDIFYRRFSDRTRAWVNAVGAILLLLPFCVFVIGVSANFVSESWAIREGSPEAGGIHGVYLIKTLIPLMALNLLLQGFAETLRNALLLMQEAE
jgi:TRAP-type mannitol/chloroaromatic compound transport system permease small subunit